MSAFGPFACRRRLAGRRTRRDTIERAAKAAMAAFEHANRQWADDPTIDLGAAIAQAGDE